MDNCPACEREFKGLEDFPRVYVVGIERLEIPENLRFPYIDSQEIFATNSRLIISGLYGELPKEVVELFKKTKGKNVEYNGYKWYRKEGLRKGEEEYHRTQDQREIIFSQLNPYLKTLEELVGKEVPTSQLLPPFDRIPETAYNLTFSEDGKTPEGNRKANLVILGKGLNLGRTGGATLKGLATVARLEYEGRINQ